MFFFFLILIFYFILFIYLFIKTEFSISCKLSSNLHEILNPSFLKKKKQQQKKHENYFKMSSTDFLSSMLRVKTICCIICSSNINPCPAE